MKDAICGRKYRKASWICFILNCFNQLSGANGVDMYANRIMLKLEELSNNNLPISALTGTYIIGMTNAAAAFACILVIWNVGRKKIFVFG